MALPVVNTVKLIAELPDGSGKRIEYRLFNKAEEKQLLFARETKERSQIIKAIADIVKNCTFGAINPEKDDYYLTDWAFCKVRSESMEPIVRGSYEIEVTDEEGNIEVKKEPLIVDTSNIEVDFPETPFQEIIDIGEDENGQAIKLKLKKPTIYSYDFDPDSEQADGNLLYNLFDSLYVGDEVMTKDDFSQEEFVAWYYNLDSKKVLEIEKNATNVPVSKVLLIVGNEEKRIGNFINFIIFRSFWDQH